MLEIEVKVKVADLKPFREKLLALGAALEKERHREENTLYDFRTQDLRQKRQALRLRTVRKKTFLTFKGTPQQSRRFKIREELESEVKNAKHFRRILKVLGFIPVFHYIKHRTVLKKGHVTICLDETAAGNFIEFEGEREKIVRLSRLLKISKKEWIKQDYIQILIQAGKAGGGPYSSSFSTPPSPGNSSS